MAMCRKNGDFASGYKKIGKDGNYLFTFYNKIWSNIITLEFQEKGLINTLPEPMVRSLFRVANKFNPVMIEEDQIRLKAHHEEKLRRQELIKAKSLKKQRMHVLRQLYGTKDS